MIKKTLAIGLTLATLAMTGCASKDTVDGKYANDSRFYNTGDSYSINDRTYDVSVDRTTNIVYLTYDNNYSGIATPIIGKDKLPMTYSEYEKSK